MSVGFVRAVEAGLRYNHVPVSFEPGWETNGNGQVFPAGKPLGLITHHTGSDYGKGLSVLLRGRPDLDPPLCNCCTYPDGRIHLIAAHPANHAGASGGPSMGPLPTTTLFNRLVWGNEVMFPGALPWTAAQYRSARVLAAVISGILGRPTPEWCRFHSETSRTGKWDPGAGRGPGKPFDGHTFRAETWAAVNQSARSPNTRTDDMPVGEWQTTTLPTLHKVVCPVGDKISAVNAEAWLSIDSSEDGQLQVDVHGLGHGLATWKDKLVANRRWWRPLPNGSESYSVTLSTVRPGSAAWCIEIRPRPSLS